MIRPVLLGAVSALVLAGCQDGAGASRDQVRAVGSSTVYPFTTAVAEQFARRNPDFKAPIVESTGTGAGMKLFCAGLGARYPDIENASRRIKKAELEDCAKNGVTQLIELQIGIDGLALAESNEGDPIRLTREQVYRALAATPYGRPQTARTWADVDSSLPAVAIQVYGPPPTSGTRDSFNELIMEKGCDANPAMKALKDSDPDRHKDICSRIREDGAFVEAGENDNLIVQKLAANPDAVGVFGFSFLEENRGTVRDVAVDGVEASTATIQGGSYPGSRPLFIYVKAAHLNAVPGLRQFVGEYASAWKPGGYLARRGLIVAPEEVRLKQDAIAAKLTPLDPATVK